jgi:hypothetical protein
LHHLILVLSQSKLRGNMNTQEQDPQKKGTWCTERRGVEQPLLAGSGSEGEMVIKPDHGEDSYKGCGKLEGKAALITGADSGIGRAVALAFAREGADVLISYHTSDEDAHESARAVEAAGRRAVLVKGDIQDEEHCVSLVEKLSPNSASLMFSSTTLHTRAHTRVLRNGRPKNSIAPTRPTSMRCSGCAVLLCHA